HLPQCSAVILSDYAKGTLGPKLIEAAIARSRARGIPVYVDPKSTDFARYRGATCITPNLRELAAAAQMPVATNAEVIAAATKVMHDAGAEAILVTRSERGMTLVEASGAVHIESQAREVFDVTGAGDTVMAVLALACATGYSLPQAMHLANTAARPAASKLRTAHGETAKMMLDMSR